MKKINILMIMILLFVGVVNADFEKTNDLSYLETTGFFNNELVNPDYTLVSGDILDVPLVTDLNNDSIIETIVMLDSGVLTGVLTVLEGLDLNLVSTLTLDQCHNLLSMTTHDIDNDGSNKEIIVNCYNEQYLVRFDGENLTQNLSYSNVDMTFGGYGDVNCVDDYCVSIVLGKISTTYALYGWVIDTDNITESYVWNGGAWFPSLNGKLKININDYDGDGTNEFILGYGYKDGSANNYRVDILNITYPSKAIVRELQEIIEAETGIGSIIASTLQIYNTDDAVGDEFIFAKGEDAKFRIYVYRYNPSTNALEKINQFPQVLKADGNIISNIFIGDFYNLGYKYLEMCVMGYEPTTFNLNMLCGTNKPFVVPQALEFNYSQINSNIGLSNYYMSVFTSEQKTSNDYNEISTPFGIFEKVDNVWGGEIDLIFNHSLANYGFSVMVDYDNDGLSEYVLKTDDNLFIIDDGLTNHYGYINYVKYDPCLDSIWQVNTSVDVTIQVKDSDNDNVCGNASIYYGESIVQESANQCGSSSSYFIFSFVANNTGNGYTVRVNGWDTENPNNIHTYDKTFSVATSGITKGECTTIVNVDNLNIPDGTGVSINDTEEETGVLGENQDPIGDNALSDSMQNTSTLTGLGTSILWLIFMFVIAFFVFVYGRGENFDGKTLIGIIGILEILMLIIGVKMEFIGVGIIWTIVAIGIIIGAVLGSRFFIRSSHGG